MKNKLLFILLLVSCVAAGAALFSLSGSPVSAVPDHESASASAQPSAMQTSTNSNTSAFQDTGTPLSHSGNTASEAFAKQIFALQYSADIAFSAPGTTVEQTIRFDISGDLIQYRQIRDDHRYQLIRIPSPDITAVVNQQVNPEIVAALRQQVQQGIEFISSPEGEILEVYLSQPHPSLKSMETIAFMMQHIVPETLSGNTHWQRTEKDYNGEFTAFYSLQPDTAQTPATDSYALFKRRELEKAVYDQVSGDQARGLENKLRPIYSFSHQARWDQQHRMLQSLSVDESVEHQLNGQPLASSNNRLVLNLTSWSEHISPTDLALIQQVQSQRQIELTAAEVFLSSGGKASQGARAQGEETAEQQKSDQNAQGMNTSAEAAYQEIKDLYDAMLSLDGLERVKAESQLSALLQNFARTYPGDLDLLTDDLAKFGTHEPGFSLYLSALSTVASHASQEAMLTTLNARINENQAAASIMASLALSPQGNTLTFERFSNMVGNSSLAESMPVNVDLAKSAMVQRMGVEDSTTANAYVSEQLRELKSAPDTSATLHHLTVLGNMGQYLSFEDLQTYTDQANADIRQRATHALRFVPGPDATDYLLQTLKDDANVTTREVAANSLSYRSMDNNTLAQIQQQIDVEQNQQIKDRLQDIVDKYAQDQSEIAQ